MGFRNAFNGIPPSSITADLLADGSVTGTKLSADAIDGKTITGAFIRTAATGKRWELSSTPANQLRGYSGRPEEDQPGVFEVDSNSLLATFKLVTPVFDPYPPAAITAASSVNGTSPGFMDITAPLVSIQSNQLSAGPAGADPNLYTDTAQTYMRDPVFGATFARLMSNQFQQFGPVNSFASQGIASTASTGTAVQINPSNWIMFRATSGLKHKLDVTPLADFLAAEQATASTPDAPVARFSADSAILSGADAEPVPAPGGRGRVIDLAPIIYRDRHEVEMHAAGDPAWTAEPGWYIGWSADDFHAAGWHELVRYDEDGEPDYLYYDRVLAVAVLEFNAELAELRARLDALSG
jgi:hypothetical protein